jgi:dTDP-4-amino-4,6-dideoxygalactose transaminase
MYVVRSPERDRIAAALREAGIGCATYYTTPLHLQPVYAGLGYEPGSLPETERAGRETIALPLWAGISPEQQERVVATVRAALTVGVGT